jgi:hypothetical protein
VSLFNLPLGTRTADFARATDAVPDSPCCGFPMLNCWPCECVGKFNTRCSACGRCLNCGTKEEQEAAARESWAAQVEAEKEWSKRPHRTARVTRPRRIR